MIAICHHGYPLQTDHDSCALRLRLYGITLTAGLAASALYRDTLRTASALLIRHLSVDPLVGVGLFMGAALRREL